MAARVVAAVDLGASGGRVVAGLVDGGELTLDVVHRFTNAVRDDADHLRWDIRRLFREVQVGLARLAERFPQVESIGVDTWGVDYGLLDASGELIADPIAYRDGCTTAVIDDVHRRIDPQQLYRINGLQFLPFTTLYQLAAEQSGPRWERAAWVVLLPDLIAYWLTGELRTELTNASTTGLLDRRVNRWSSVALDAIGVPESMLAPLEAPGVTRGVLLPTVGASLGLANDVVVTTVGSHDTASAVAGLPATSTPVAYAISGTWSLVGIETGVPVMSADARAANFTNELGIDGRTRFLRNVGGLWLLQECLREWGLDRSGEALERLLDEAASLPAGPTFEVDDPALIPPGDMPSRIEKMLAGRAPASRTPAALTRAIVDSLADAYARTLRTAAGLAGTEIGTVHLVGGGSRNALLCQLTADAIGLDVVAGPVETTALGNVLVQARSIGALPGDLDLIRAGLAASQPVVMFHPR